MEEKQRGRHICPPDHKHGATGTCYVSHKCRCDECLASRAAAARRRRRAKAYGRFDWHERFVDAEPVRQHVHALMAAGIGWKHIAELAGVGNTAISQLIYGRKGSGKDPRKGEQLKRILKATAGKIMAVQPSAENLRDGARIDGRPTTLRLQALVTIGWSGSHLARQLGWGSANLWQVINGQSLIVSAGTARAVRNLFDQLAMHPAPAGYSATRARNHAQAKGWLPPLALDLDDRLDNVVPDATARNTARPQQFDPELVEWALQWGDEHPDDDRGDVAARYGLTRDQYNHAYQARARRNQRNAA